MFSNLREILFGSHDFKYNKIRGGKNYERVK